MQSSASGFSVMRKRCCKSGMLSMQAVSGNVNRRELKDGSVSGKVVQSSGFKTRIQSCISRHLRFNPCDISYFDLYSDLLLHHNPKEGTWCPEKVIFLTFSCFWWGKSDCPTVMWILWLAYTNTTQSIRSYWMLLSVSESLCAHAWIWGFQMCPGFCVSLYCFPCM